LCDRDIATVWEPASTRQSRPRIPSPWISTPTELSSKTAPSIHKLQCYGVVIQWWSSWDDENFGFWYYYLATKCHDDSPFFSVPSFLFKMPIPLVLLVAPTHIQSKYSSNFSDWRTYSMCLKRKWRLPRYHLFYVYMPLIWHWLTFWIYM